MAKKQKEITLQDLWNRLDDIQEQIAALQTHIDILFEPTAHDGQTERSDIPNTEYITITRDGAFVGGVKATQYRGEDIYELDELPKYFVQIKALVDLEYGLDVAELHAMSSETKGTYAEPGDPSPNHGCNAWVRAKFADGTVSRWVFYYSYLSSSGCAGYCAYSCGYYVRLHSVFRSGAFGAVALKK